MLTLLEANAKRPVKPDSISPIAWFNYYDDLACWKATQAERYLSGIKEDPNE